MLSKFAFHILGYEVRRPKRTTFPSCNDLTLINYNSALYDKMFIIILVYLLRFVHASFLVPRINNEGSKIRYILHSNCSLHYLAASAEYTQNTTNE